MRLCFNDLNIREESEKSKYELARTVFAFDFNIYRQPIIAKAFPLDLG